MTKQNECRRDGTVAHAHSMKLTPASLVLVALALLSLIAHSQSTPPKEAPMTLHAAGPFDVKVTPEEDKSAEPQIGRAHV